MALDKDTIEGFVRACLKKHFNDEAEIPSCHREWWGMCCSSNKFVALAAPRGHAKSTAITLSYTLATVLFRERKFILLVSDTESQSTFFLGNIKKELLNNEDIQKLFGVKGLIKDSETDCIVEFDDGHQARIVAKGSEQKLRGINWNGSRPDLIICDDMENDEIVLNKERREKFRRWFTGALLPCRSKEGIIRIVGTILHMDSLLERLMPKPWLKGCETTDLKDVSATQQVWYAAKYRAHPSITDFSRVLWPEYKDANWLKAEQQQYREQGLGDVYAQEYLNQPIDDSNSLFRRGDFKKSSEDDKKSLKNFYVSCDLAVTEKSRSDWSVFIVGGVDENSRLHIVEVIRERIDSLQIIDTLDALTRKYDPQFVVVEKGAITNSILPMVNVRMMETNNYYVLHTMPSTVDKVQRSQSIRARMRAGHVFFDKEADWFVDLEQELIRFPRDRHDDQVDALSLLGMALDKFIEAPTQEEVQEELDEEEFNMYVASDLNGRSMVTGY